MKKLLTACAVVLASVGCGGSEAAIDSGPLGSDGGAVDSGTADAAAEVDSGVAEDAGGSDAGDVDGGSPGDAGSATDGGTIITDASGARVEITGLAAWANCMPVVAPDPIHASWTATVSGATGAAATVTSATLTITPPTGADTVQSITVSPPAIALVGGAGSADQSKTAATTNPMMACTRLCGTGTTAQLDIAFAIDGATVSATSMAPFECVY